MSASSGAANPTNQQRAHIAPDSCNKPFSAFMTHAGMTATGSNAAPAQDGRSPTATASAAVAAGRSQALLAVVQHVMQQGDLKGVLRLVHMGADANTWATSVGTPLMMAARAGDLPAIKVLLQWGANVDAPDIDAQQPRTKVLSVMHEQGCSWDVAELKGRGTALMQASFEGHVHAVRSLVAAGARVDVQDWLGRTALAYAVRGGSLQVVSALLDGGADPNVPAADGLTPLHVAAERGDLRALQCMLAKGGDSAATTANGGYTLLMAAVRHSAVIAELLKLKSCDINACDTDGCTALMAACAAGRAASVQLLLKAGAEPNAVDHWGCSALHHCVYAAQHDAIGRLNAWYDLLQAGCDCELRNVNGFTALEEARGDPCLDQLVSDVLELGGRGRGKGPATSTAAKVSAVATAAPQQRAAADAVTAVKAEESMQVLSRPLGQQHLEAPGGRQELFRTVGVAIAQAFGAFHEGQLDRTQLQAALSSCQPMQEACSPVPGAVQATAGGAQVGYAPGAVPQQQHRRAEGEAGSQAAQASSSAAAGPGLGCSAEGLLARDKHSVQAVAVQLVMHNMVPSGRCAGPRRRRGWHLLRVVLGSGRRAVRRKVLVHSQGAGPGRPRVGQQAGGEGSLHIRRGRNLGAQCRTRVLGAIRRTRVVLQRRQGLGQAEVGKRRSGRWFRLHPAWQRGCRAVPARLRRTAWPSPQRSIGVGVPAAGNLSDADSSTGPETQKQLQEQRHASQPALKQPASGGHSVVVQAAHEAMARRAAGQGGEPGTSAATALHTALRPAVLSPSILRPTIISPVISAPPIPQPGSASTPASGLAFVPSSPSCPPDGPSASAFHVPPPPQSIGGLPYAPPTLPFGLHGQGQRPHTPGIGGAEAAGTAHAAHNVAPSPSVSGASACSPTVPAAGVAVLLPLGVLQAATLLQSPSAPSAATLSAGMTTLRQLPNAAASAAGYMPHSVSAPAAGSTSSGTSLELSSAGAVPDVACQGSEEAQGPHARVAQLMSQERRDRRWEEEHACVCCLERVREVVLEPCGHMVLCARCCAEIQAAKNEVRRGAGQRGGRRCRRRAQGCRFGRQRIAGRRLNVNSIRFCAGEGGQGGLHK